MARIAIAGASGFVGMRLAASLLADGHQVVRLVRRTAAGPDEASWDPGNGKLDVAALEGIEGFVHLSGESIAGGRWTTARKRVIVESRTVTTRLVAAQLAKLGSKPALVSASAIGIYGDRGSEWVDETSRPGHGFLAEVCVEWERAADAARDAGLRVVHPRIGIVLDPAGGALAPMLIPFRLGLGGRLGSGTQYMSWITLDDLVAALRHCLVSATLSGPVNAVAPSPVTNAEFTAALARALSRPAFLSVPGAILRLALGEAADELLLGGARVSSRKLENSGFRFRDVELDAALKRILATQ
jgi:uncharacterized protein (TIGR01777 family)